MNDFVDTLRVRLAGQLPGPAAQLKMASLRRLQELGPHLAPPPDARVACVLNLLHWKDGAWHTTLIRRTTNPRDRHSGQVSFPGGRWEEHDEQLAHVALRETEEEIGIPAAQVELIGQLTDLYIPVSNYLVHPFVGILHGPPRFSPQPGEVESVLTPALKVFQTELNRKVIDLTLPQGVTIKNVPYFDVDGHIVWGATAMIMNEFLELVGDGGR